MKKAESDTNQFWRARNWAAGAVLALAGLASCGDDGDGGTETDTEGLAMCCEIGSVCHLTAADPIGGPKQVCHSLGHQNDPAACREQYEDCLDVCGAEPMEMEHGCL